MVRLTIAASSALAAVFAFAPAAWAADGDATVLVQDGTIICQLSADAVDRGGGPMVVCQRTDGQPFVQSVPSAEKNTVRLLQMVFRSTGEFHWDGGNLRDVSGVTGDGPSIGAGQTYRANGWTVTGEGPRTRITSDTSTRGILLYAGVARVF